MMDRQSPSHEAAKQRFDQLVPFFVAGQLSDEDYRFVIGYLTKDPEAVNSVVFTRQIADAMSHIGAERDQAAAVERFSLSFEGHARSSLRKRLSIWLDSWSVKPWALALLALFVAENGFIVYRASHYNQTELLSLNGGLLIADADARFILKNGVPLDQFLDVASKYRAVIIYSLKTPVGSEIHVDLGSESEAQAFANELALLSLVKPEETRVAVINDGPKTFVQRFDTVKPQSMVEIQVRDFK